MKLKIALLISVVLLAAANGQESRLSTGGSAPPIGLVIGQRAPQFTLVDQFGREQSNETLKGPKGTIVLFFRSADW